MNKRLPKDKFARFTDIRDPAKSVGLWAHHVFRETAIYPEGRTRETVDRYLHEDVERARTFADARAAMLAKDAETDKAGKPRKTAPQKIREYAEEFHLKGVESIPRWFFPWHRYGRWLNMFTARGEKVESSTPATGNQQPATGNQQPTTNNQQPATHSTFSILHSTFSPPAPVRLSFDSPSMGACAHEGNLHAGRMFFLRRPAPTTNHEPPTTNHEPPTTNHEPRITHSSFSILHSTFSPSTSPDLVAAIECMLKTHRASTAHFQRQLCWGYNHAAKVIDLLVARGILAPREGVSPNRILLNDEELRKTLGHSTFSILHSTFSPATGNQQRATPATHSTFSILHSTFSPATLSLSFLVNAMMSRDTTKSVGRDWQSYCWAYPEDAKRPIIAWNGRASAEAVVAQDGVMLVDREHADEALRAMTYVVVPGREPTAPGGAYNGYFLRDRIFFGEEKVESSTPSTPSTPSTSTRHEPRTTSHEPRTTTLSRFLGARAAEYEKRFIEMVERDPLSDKKSEGYFKLEAPIAVTPGPVAEAVSREFNRIVHTGTMGYERQMTRPAHEVALGLWLARMGSGMV